MEAWTLGAPLFLFLMNEPKEAKEKGRRWGLASLISNITVLERQNYAFHIAPFWEKSRECSLFLIKTKNNQKKTLIEQLRHWGRKSVHLNDVCIPILISLFF